MTAWTRSHEHVARFASAPVLRGDLALVQQVITQALPTGFPPLAEAAGTLAAGGKRLRPLLALACGYAATGPDAPAPARVIRAAAAIELMHLATLAHDDVMDAAGYRHGTLSVNAQWGNARAVLVGDFLLAAAARIGAGLGVREVDLLAETLQRLCQGQALETGALFSVERDDTNYLDAIEGKTASLMRATCELSALQAGLPPHAVTALGAFGHHAGVAYQILDDVRDLTAAGDEQGKPANQDLPRGVYTLPVIYALKSDPDLAALLGTDDPGRVAEAREIVLAGPGPAAALALADSHAGRARQALVPCAEHLRPEGVEMLNELVVLMLGRAVGGTPAIVL